MKQSNRILSVKNIKVQFDISDQFNFPWQKRKIIKAVDRANDLRIKSLFQRVKKIVNNKFNKIQIGLLGISFKPNTDDVRESPGIKLARDLSKTPARGVF